MDLSARDFELIQRHLQDQLAPGDDSALAERLADADFRAELDFSEKLFAALHGRENRRLKKMLAEEENRYAPADSGGQGPQFSFWKFALAAAAIIALFLVARSFFEEKTDTNALFAEFFSPFENSVVVADRQAAPKNDLEKAFRAYDEGRLPEAAERLAALAQKPGADATLVFYKCIAQLGSGEAKSALPDLKTLAANRTFRFQQAAKWYLALAHLKMGDVEQAQLVLTEIQNDAPNPFAQMAASLRLRL